ncbi:hypothetical protein [Phenylobacterium sp.]|uniref:hypothetical protein n=1 Tax=Phenylobacterium sp. TaxID=1871053 RepID=UPI0035B14800
MLYLCYVHRTSGGVPHFEVLPDMSASQAAERAAAILAQRPDGVRAELWQEDVLLLTLPARTAAAA